MKVRYDMSHIDLSKDDPETVDLSHMPDWLRPQIRELLKSMDHANKATGQVINIKEGFTVDLEDGQDPGGGEIVEEDE